MESLHVLKNNWMKRDCILLAALFFSCFPLLSNPIPLLPLDQNIGQVIEAEPNSIEQTAKTALSQSYSLSWIETYIPSSMRTGFVFTYDRLLASLLPLQQLQVAAALKRGHLFEIPFCYHEPTYGYGSMTWMQNEDGRYVLLSLSVHE